MGVCRATAEWLRMPVLPALVASNLWACGRASPVARPTQVEHLAAMAFAAGAKQMWTVVVLIVVDAKRDSCASNLEIAYRPSATIIGARKQAAQMGFSMAQRLAPTVVAAAPDVALVQSAQRELTV